MASSDQSAAAGMTLRLARCGARDAGHAFGLRRDDLLVAVNGRPWTGTADALVALFSGAGGAPVLMTFQRSDAVFSVLVPRGDLGLWEAAPQPARLPEGPKSAAGLVNWLILVGPDGLFEAVALRPPLLALVAPAVWLAQMRMWTWLATLGAALALAMVGSPLLALAVWLAAGVHLWRMGPDHLLSDRNAEGFNRVGVIAARSEAEASACWTALAPESRFRFDPVVRDGLGAVGAG